MSKFHEALEGYTEAKLKINKPLKYFIILSFILSSCAVSSHFDGMRASRKIKKAMRLDPARFQNDTIIIRDTVIVKSVEVDTVTNIVYHDTIKVIDNSKVVLKYFYDSTTHEIWHEVECKGDTVFIENEVIVEKVTTGTQKQCIILDRVIGPFRCISFFC